MTHKKFHRIRWISMAIVAVLITAIIVSFLSADGGLLEKSFVPIILVVIIVFAFILLFGRIICGFFCPLGFLQDIVWKLTKRLHLPKLKRNENFMKIVNIFNKNFLIFFILGITSLIGICIVAPEILQNVKIPMFVFVLIPMIMIFVNSFARRFFCNVCPIGSFIGLFERLNIVKLEKDCSSCTVCGNCYEACPMRIKELYTELEKKKVSGSRCIYCGECIKKCPEDNVLVITVFGKKVYTSSQEDFLNNQFTDIN